MDFRSLFKTTFSPWSSNWASGSSRFSVAQPPLNSSLASVQSPRFASSLSASVVKSESSKPVFTRVSKVSDSSLATRSTSGASASSLTTRVSLAKNVQTNSSFDGARQVLSATEANLATLDGLLSTVEFYNGQLSALNPSDPEFSSISKSFQDAVNEYVAAAANLATSITINFFVRQSGQKSAVSHEVSGIAKVTGFEDLQATWSNFQYNSGVNNTVMGARDTFKAFQNQIIASQEAVNTVANLPKNSVSSNTTEELFSQKIQETLKNLS